MNITPKRLAELSALTALALIIFVVELRIPDLLPIPGVKLGLANIITVYAVYRYRGIEVFMVVLVRILFGSMFSGGVSTMLYSLAGGMLCLSGMLLVRHIIPPRHLWLCSIIGAILHNTGQMIMAVLLMKTTAVLCYYPILLFSGCIAGLFTGLCAGLVVSRVGGDGQPH
ncbi:MAG: Gx transporter family protein [Ruminococcus sp.]|nr:Gx transporter family protein [Ruminococcus sp.]